MFKNNEFIMLKIKVIKKHKILIFSKKSQPNISKIDFLSFLYIYYSQNMHKTLEDFSKFDLSFKSTVKRD